MNLKIKDIEIDDYIYPRPQKDQRNVDSLVEKLKAGIQLDPIIVQKVKMHDDKERVITLYGGHRLVAYEEFNKMKGYERINDIQVDFWKEKIIDYDEYKDEMLIYSYKINDKQGLNMRNMDTKHTARKLRMEHPGWSAEAIGKKLDRVKSSIWEHIKDIIQEQEASDHRVIMRLVRLGWTQEEISDAIGKTHQAISEIAKKFDTEQICNLFEKGKKIGEIAKLHDIDIQAAWSIVLEDKSDMERFESLNLSPKVYNVWNFIKCNPLFGIDHPGRVPGQIALNLLYQYTKQGDLVVDPMAGGGSTVDACLVMGRKCRAYDIEPMRYDIKQHDIVQGFHKKCKNCNFIFLDPPYWRLQKGCYSNEGVEESTLDEWYGFMKKISTACYNTIKEDGYVALLLEPFLDEKVNNMFVDLPFKTLSFFEESGFTEVQRIYCPIPSQIKNHRDVEYAKQNNILLDLNRDLIILRR